MVMMLQKASCIYLIHFIICQPFCHELIMVAPSRRLDLRGAIGIEAI
jgi:hypothetical protein